MTASTTRPEIAPRARYRAPLALLVAALAAAETSAQVDVFRGLERAVDPDYRHDPDRTEVSTFALRAGAEVRLRFQLAGDALRRGDFRAAAEPLQELINLYPAHFLQVGERPARYVGAAEYAKYLLAAMPPEGRDEYARFSALRAGPLWRALAEGADAERIVEFSAFWEATPEGLLGLERLAALALERGDFALARRVYERRLAHEDAEGETAARLAFAAAAAATLEGESVRAAELMARFQVATAEVGGESLPAGEALAGIAAVAPARPYTWPTIGGNAAHDALPRFEPSALTLRSRWTAPAFSLEQYPPWRSLRDPRLAFPFRAVVDREGLVLSDGLAVRSYSLFSPEPKWSFESPLLRSDESDHHAFEDYLSTRSPTESPLGSLARGAHLAATLAGDLVIAPLIEPQERGPEIRFDGIRIVSAIPKRTLYALDRQTGRLRWTMRRPERSPRDFVNAASINAPPIVVGDRVYASAYVLEGAISLSIVCLALHDGRLLWHTPVAIGQQELTMFNKPLKEFTLQQPAERDGAIYVSTNLGLVACLDALTGNPRWITQYPVITIHGAVNFRSTRERHVAWTNDPPVVKDGVVVVTPLDSDSCFAFDAGDGRLLWRVPAGQGHKYEYASLLGIDQGAVVLGGLSGIGFHDLATGHVLNGYRFPSPNAWAGRACLVAGAVYQPLDDGLGLLELRFQNQEIGVTFTERRHPMVDEEPGNLLLHDDFQIFLSRDRVAVYCDLDRRVTRARERIASGSAGAEEKLELGEILALLGDHDQAIALLESLRAGASQDVDRRARERLAASHRELAARREAAGDVAGAIASRRAELDVVVDDFAFLRAAEELIRLEAGDRERLLEILARIERRCPDALHPFAVDEYGFEIPAGLFVQLMRADLALTADDPAAAVGAWQAVIERYPSHELLGGLASDVARRRIAQLVEAHGDAIYAPFEAAAGAARRAAVERGDAAALLAAIERWPNAGGGDLARLDLAAIRLERGDAAAAFEALAPLLPASRDPAVSRRAIGLAGRAAAALREPALARALLERALEGGDRDPLLVTTLAALPEAAPARRVRLSGLPETTARRIALPEDRLVQLVEVAFDRDDAVLLYEEDPAGRRDATLRRIDLATGAELWRADLEAYYLDTEPLRGVALADHVVIRQRDRLLGFDRRSGVPAFRRELPAETMVLATDGVMLFALSELGVDRGLVLAFDPATGSEVWRLETPFAARDLQTVEGHVVVVGKEPRLAVLDALTGARRYEIADFSVSSLGIEARAFPEHDLLLTLGRDADRKPLLQGYTLATGALRFTVDSPPLAITLAWVESVGDVLVLPQTTGGRTAATPRNVVDLLALDPATGALGSRVPRLESLRGFDFETAIAGEQLLLVGADPRSRQGGIERIVVADLARGAVTATYDLDPLPTRSLLTFRGLATAGGEAFGVIDVRSARPESWLFLLPKEGKLELTRISRDSDRTISRVAVTPGYLAVLRGGTLYTFAARSSG
jgi:outer membrane protein assembly factor BamB